ncbi:MAG: shikimate kinase [Vicinamibacteria bacterium]|nr:shikimate kinase [Vicinamibacteria bacterium]
MVGFMGSGKSTVGRRLAAMIHFRFADTDDEIEAGAHARVADIFRERGEAGFRELERQTISDLLNGDRCVIATGGGAFAEAACAEDLLARSFTVYLSCDFDEAFRRAASLGGRPLLDRGETGAAALYAERKAKYSRAHVAVETTHRSPDEVVSDILRLLPRP